MKTKDRFFVVLFVLCALSLTQTLAQKKPRFIKLSKTRDSYEVLRGESVKIKCFVTGIEDPLHNRTLVAWKKEGVSGYIYNWPRFSVKVGRFLKIVNTVKEDSGKYTCFASNENGAIKKTFTLIVREGVISDSSVISDGPIERNQPTRATNKQSGKVKHRRDGYPPRFNRRATLQNRILSYPLGETAKLKCQATGKPEPSIKWLKNGKEHRQSLGSNSWVLSLQYLGKSDAGKYTCVVSNKYGTINSTFSLEVQDRPLTEPLIDRTSLKNISSVAGDNVTFICKAYSETYPNSQWLKWSPGDNGSTNGTRIQFNFISERDHAANQHLSKETEKERRDWYTFKLHLTNVQSRDEGRYACLVGNNAGYSTAGAFLTVYTPEAPNSKQQSEFEINLPLWVFIVVPIILLVFCVCIVVWCCKVIKSSEPEKKDPNPKKAAPEQVKLQVAGPVCNGYTNRQPINPEKFLNFKNDRIQNYYVDWNKPGTESVMQTKSSLVASEDMNGDKMFNGTIVTAGSRRSEPSVRSDHVYSDIDSRSHTSSSTNHTTGMQTYLNT